MEYLKPGWKRGCLPIIIFQTVYEHTPTESGKGRTVLYIDKNIKYKLCNDLNIYEKRWLSLLLSEL